MDLYNKQTLVYFITAGSSNLKFAIQSLIDLQDVLSITG